MSKPITEEYVLSKLREWAGDEIGTPNLLVSRDNGSFHLGYYAGMGNSDNTPIEKLDPIYKKIIEQLYRSGALQVSGKAYTLYPGSDFFLKLAFKNEGLYAEK